MPRLLRRQQQRRPRQLQWKRIQKQSHSRSLMAVSVVVVAVIVCELVAIFVVVGIFVVVVDSTLKWQSPLQLLRPLQSESFEQQLEEVVEQEEAQRAQTRNTKDHCLECNNNLDEWRDDWSESMKHRDTGERMKTERSEHAGEKEASHPFLLSIPPCEISSTYGQQAQQTRIRQLVARANVEGRRERTINHEPSTIISTPLL